MQDLNSLVARTNSDLNNAYQQLVSSKWLGCDTETSGFSSNNCRLVSVQLSNGNFSVLIPINEGATLGPLADLLNSTEHVKVIHNARFDLQFLFRANYTVRNVFDSMIAEKLITKGADQSSSLEETLYRYFGVSIDKSLRQLFTSKNWNGRWTPELVDYALNDVKYLPQLGLEQELWLNRLRLMDEFRKRMNKLILPT
jgi:ribonuclease D